MEGAVGHHRGHHRAHARIGVGPADGLQSFRGRGRELEAQVVGGGASLAHHLHRADEGGEVLVLEGSPAGDPGCRVEQQLQGPAIADALGEVVVAVGVGVDEARHEQAAGSRRARPRRRVRPSPAVRSRARNPLSTRMSAGSAAWRSMSSSRPPRMIVFIAGRTSTILVCNRCDSSGPVRAGPPR